MPMMSQAQRGLMYATLAGADTGVPKKVAQDFADSDKPGRLPGHVNHQHRRRKHMAHRLKHPKD